MSQYQDTRDLIEYIYYSNGRHLPLSFEDVLKDVEFSVYAFGAVLETIELMENEDYVTDEDDE